MPTLDHVELRFDLLCRLSRAQGLLSSYELTPEEAALFELPDGNLNTLATRLRQLDNGYISPSLKLEAAYMALNLLPIYTDDNLRFRRRLFAEAHEEEIAEEKGFTRESRTTIVTDWERTGLHDLAAVYVTALRHFHMTNTLQLIIDDPYLDASTKERVKIALRAGKL